MAKNFVKPRKHESGRTITTKTAYGTDSSMVVNDENILGLYNIPEGFVLCVDDEGHYVTKNTHVDNNVADCYRHCYYTREQFITRSIK